MKLAFQLAYKNLIGAGLKTWLNVGILAFAFILIVFFNGFMDGWNKQAVIDATEWEYGAGQLIHQEYDAMDPFTILDGHGTLSDPYTENLTPILLRQGTIYPDGRMVPMVIKGIPQDQEILKLPTNLMKSSEADIPAIIGSKFARTNDLELGEDVLMRWRDKNGTFDATNITIAGIFETDVTTVDAGQVWIDIDQLYKMTGLDGEATLYVANEDYSGEAPQGWVYQSRDDLLSSLYQIISTKKASSSILYVFLLAIALLAIFDTQVLSIFRRQKEIGTYISLGMTRQQVVKLFTVEGAMYSIMAAGVALIIGAPLLLTIANVGIPIPEASRNAGVAMSAKIYPVYGFILLITTFFLVVLAATIVSYMPARKISKMDPVNALKGKIQ